MDIWIVTIPTYLLIFCSTLLFSVISYCLVLILRTSPYPVIKRHEEEKYYEDVRTDIKHKFPSLSDPSTIVLSVIVPAYEEEDRLPPMIEECLIYLDELHKNDANFSYEVIVVDDGSSDRTSEIALRYSANYGTENVRVLTLVENRGKGGAVRMGMESARGSLLLFADADGATKFSDVAKLQEMLKTVTDRPVNRVDDTLPPVIVCGSRSHLEEQAIAQRSIFRTLLMRGFHLLVWCFGARGVRDTQCGFKLFTRDAARKCFQSLHVERWAFDVELLYIAQCYQIPIKEVAVNWTEIEGTKLVPFWSWVQMAQDLLLIWARHRIGVWKIAKID